MGDDDAKKDPVADVKKEEKKEDDDGKEDAKKVTSAELRKRITAILKEADLEKTSAKKVRSQLEEDLGGQDLTSRKDEINGIIKQVMDEMDDDDDEDEDGGGDDDD